MTLNNPHNPFMLWFIRTILFILFVGMLLCSMSCSPEQKLNKLLTTHPSLIKKDSVLVHDTIVIPGAASETTTRMSEGSRDTIHIYHNNISTEYVKQPGDSIWIKTKCPSDTIYKDHFIPVYHYRDCPPDHSKPWYKPFFHVPWWVKVLLIISAVGVVLMLIAKIIK